VSIAFEPSSFRDPNARVFTADGEILRALGPRGHREFETLLGTTFYRRFLERGSVIPSEPVDAEPFHARGLPRQWVSVLRHTRVPFISYPYEWSFGMLRDAALLHLELMEAALAEGMVLKDSSPFNYQWFGSRPLLVDVGSFEKLAPGETWIGYRQFCQTFLYPLLLEAQKGIDFRPLLRSRLDGIEPKQCARIMGPWSALRPGVLKHVLLQSALSDAYADTRADLSNEVASAGFDTGLIRSNLRGLGRVIRSLRAPRTSKWAAYTTDHRYAAQDESAKNAFVARAIATRRWSTVWDLGCNTGTFARAAARGGEHVVAVDSDPVVIDRLYEELKSAREEAVLPLVVDVADPSPATGWRGRERRPFAARGAPDLVLCLALVHHLVISSNIPLAEVVEWLRSLGGAVVVEFVTRADPMVRRLLLNKKETHEDYDVAPFEEALRTCFRVVERATLPSGTRVLYFVVPEK
jgi:SAM-dependent methyltransferase